MHFKFLMALGVYAGLALLAGITLTGTMRLAVWIFLAGLAVKTWLATLQRP